MGLWALVALAKVKLTVKNVYTTSSTAPPTHLGRSFQKEATQSDNFFYFWRC